MASLQFASDFELPPYQKESHESSLLNRRRPHQEIRDGKLNGTDTQRTSRSDSFASHTVNSPEPLEQDSDRFQYSNTIPSSGSDECGFYFTSCARRHLAIAAETQVAEEPATLDLRKAAKPKVNQQPLFYVEVSECRRGKPDLTLYSLQHLSTSGAAVVAADHAPGLPAASELKSGNIIGSAKFPHFSRNMQLSLGDPSTALADSHGVSTGYEELRCTSAWTHSQYRFQFRGQSFIWQRTNDKEDGVRGGVVLRKMALDNYKLLRSGVDSVDCQQSQGETLAVFLVCYWKWKKRGTLRLMPNIFASGDHHDKELKTMIFLSCTAILEKSRRRANARAAVAAGGGA